MDKKPCNCKTEGRVNDIVNNIDVEKQHKIKKKKYGPIIGILNILIPIVLYFMAIILIIPFILFLIFSKRAKRGFVIKLPLQKLIKNV